MSNKKYGWPKGKKINQVVISYVDVGNISPPIAEAFIDRWLDKFKTVIKQLQNQGIAMITIPVRGNSSTRMEVMPLGIDPEVSVSLMDSLCSKDELPQDDPPQDDDDVVEDDKTWFSTLSNSLKAHGVKIELEEEE